MARQLDGLPAATTARRTTWAGPRAPGMDDGDAGGGSASVPLPGGGSVPSSQAPAAAQLQVPAVVPAVVPEPQAGPQAAQAQAAYAAMEERCAAQLQVPAVVPAVVPEPQAGPQAAQAQAAYAAMEERCAAQLQVPAVAPAVVPEPQAGPQAAQAQAATAAMEERRAALFQHQQVMHDQQVMQEREALTATFARAVASEQLPSGAAQGGATQMLHEVPASSSVQVSMGGFYGSLGEAGLRRLAEADDAKAGCLLGRTLMARGEAAEAVKWMRWAAEEKGDAEAIGLLGSWYMQGKGVPQDEPEGLKLCRRSCETAIEQGINVEASKAMLVKVNAMISLQTGGAGPSGDGDGLEAELRRLAEAGDAGAGRVLGRTLMARGEAAEAAAMSGPPRSTLPPEYSDRPSGARTAQARGPAAPGTRMLAAPPTQQYVTQAAAAAVRIGGAGYIAASAAAQGRAFGPGQGGASEGAAPPPGGTMGPGFNVPPLAASAPPPAVHHRQASDRAGGESASAGAPKGLLDPWGVAIQPQVAAQCQALAQERQASAEHAHAQAHAQARQDVHTGSRATLPEKMEAVDAALRAMTQVLGGPLGAVQSQTNHVKGEMHRLMHDSNHKFKKILKFCNDVSGNTKQLQQVVKGTYIEVAKLKERLISAERSMLTISDRELLDITIKTCEGCAQRAASAELALRREQAASATREQLFQAALQSMQREQDATVRRLEMIEERLTDLPPWRMQAQAHSLAPADPTREPRLLPQSQPAQLYAEHSPPALPSPPQSNAEPDFGAASQSMEVHDDMEADEADEEDVDVGSDSPPGSDDEFGVFAEGELGGGDSGPEEEESIAFDLADPIDSDDYADSDDDLSEEGLCMEAGAGDEAISGAGAAGNDNGAAGQAIAAAAPTLAAPGQKRPRDEAGASQPPASAPASRRPRAPRRVEPQRVEPEPVNPNVAGMRGLAGFNNAEGALPGPLAAMVERLEAVGEKAAKAAIRAEKEEIEMRWNETEKRRMDAERRTLWETLRTAGLANSEHELARLRATLNKHERSLVESLASDFDEGGTPGDVGRRCGVLAPTMHEICKLTYLCELVALDEAPEDVEMSDDDVEAPEDVEMSDDDVEAPGDGGDEGAEAHDEAEAPSYAAGGRGSGQCKRREAEAIRLAALLDDGAIEAGSKALHVSCSGLEIDADLMDDGAISFLNIRYPSLYAFVLDFVLRQLDARGQRDEFGRVGDCWRLFRYIGGGANKGMLMSQIRDAYKKELQEDDAEWLEDDLGAEGGATGLADVGTGREKSRVPQVLHSVANGDTVNLLEQTAAAGKMTIDVTGDLSDDGGAPAEPAAPAEPTGDQLVASLTNQEVEDMLRQRSEARMQRDYHTADMLRDRLREAGIQINDNSKMWTAGGKQGSTEGPDFFKSPSAKAGDLGQRTPPLTARGDDGQVARIDACAELRSVAARCYTSGALCEMRRGQGLQMKWQRCTFKELHPENAGARVLINDVPDEMDATFVRLVDLRPLPAEEGEVTRPREGAVIDIQRNGTWDRWAVAQRSALDLDVQGGRIRIKHRGIDGCDTEGGVSGDRATPRPTAEGYSGGGTFDWSRFLSERSNANGRSGMVSLDEYAARSPTSSLAPPAQVVGMGPVLVRDLSSDRFGERTCWLLDKVGGFPATGIRTAREWDARTGVWRAVRRPSKRQWAAALKRLGAKRDARLHARTRALLDAGERGNAETEFKRKLARAPTLTYPKTNALLGHDDEGLCKLENWERQLADSSKSREKWVDGGSWARGGVHARGRQINAEVKTNGKARDTLRLSRQTQAAARARAQQSARALQEMDSQQHTNRQKRQLATGTYTRATDRNVLCKGIAQVCSGQDIKVLPKLANTLKPHQWEGLEFVWDAIISRPARRDAEEDDAEEEDGGGVHGCILGHSMGLGKTLQSIALMHTLRAYDLAKRFVLVAPANVLFNWVQEIRHWLPDGERLVVYNIKPLGKLDRARAVERWSESGGVLLFSFEGFADLMSSTGADIHETVRKAVPLLRDRAELVIVDEGHELKSEKTIRSAAFRKVTCPRRVILTGYPLQNKLEEYWSMMNFVQPGYLKSENEFRRKFVVPIKKGNTEGADRHDRRRMKRKLHYLRGMVEDVCHRLGPEVLSGILEADGVTLHESVLITGMEPFQEALYDEYIKLTQHLGTEHRLGSGFVRLHGQNRAMSHPHLFKEVDVDGIRDSRLKAGKVNDGDLGTLVGSAASLMTTALVNELLHEAKDAAMVGALSSEELQGIVSRALNGAPETQDVCKSLATFDWSQHSSDPEALRQTICNLMVTMYTSKRWHEVRELVAKADAVELARTNETLAFELDFSLKAAAAAKAWRLAARKVGHAPPAPGAGAPLDPSLSGKLRVLMAILDAAWSVGEKVVVYSKSVEFIKRVLVGCLAARGLEEGTGFFVIAGDASSTDRQAYVKAFNASATARCFVLSRAGALGINLTSANHVVLYDEDWNPCHRNQALHRCFRMGQTKPVHVYRFLGGGTDEEHIYTKSLQKERLFSSVVDCKDVGLTGSRSSGLRNYVKRPPELEKLRDLALDEALGGVLCSVAAAAAREELPVLRVYKAEDDMPFDEKLDHLERVSALQEAERELSQEAALRDAAQAAALGQAAPPRKLSRAERLARRKTKELLERARQEAEEAGVDLSGAEAATQQQTGHAMAGVEAAQKYEAQPFASQLGEATAPQQAGASGQ